MGKPTNIFKIDNSMLPDICLRGYNFKFGKITLFDDKIDLFALSTLHKGRVINITTRYSKKRYDYYVRDLADLYKLIGLLQEHKTKFENSIIFISNFADLVYDDIKKIKELIIILNCFIENSQIAIGLQTERLSNPFTNRHSVRGGYNLLKNSYYRYV